jgi:predicted ABC-type ATPase
MEWNDLRVERHVPGGYLASILSDYLRRRWLDAGISFTFETVMSSRDKLDLIRDAGKRGYRTYLYYICTNSALINEERVASRVRKGGHDVPKSKILARYDRSLDLLAECIRLTDRAYLFDNSEESHRPVAEFESGRLVTLYSPPPAWFVRAWPDLQAP